MATINEQQGLREFIAVVEQGSFTAAAQALDVSTSFVSRQVGRLEDRLGARLLNRTTRSQTLTELGQTYYQRSRDILDELERLESDMADLQEKPKGLVRVTAAGLYAERFVAPAIAEFMQRYPEVSVELNTAMQVVDIVAEGYDLAVRMSALDDSSLVARKVVDRRVSVGGSPAYFEQHGRPKTPEDLRRHNCLQLGAMEWRFAWPDSVRSVRVRGNWVSDNASAITAAAIRGIGLARLAHYYFDDAVARGELELVLEDYEPQDAATWLIYPNREYLPTRVRYLVDFLAERLKDGVGPR
ncbi:MAG: LysR family transcriptional regulator [Chromatiales bacterium]|nr:MAG: LysR family transcriptional regulator [Chromatiales bacterium]